MCKKHLIFSIIVSMLFFIIVLLLLFIVNANQRDATSLRNASKDEIISVFKSNIADFSAVQKHLETIQGELYAYADSPLADHIVIDREMHELQDDKLQESIDIITKQLHFDGIYGTGDRIDFNADPGDPPRGIIYSKDKMVPDISFPTVEPILDGWYYYEKYEMGGI